MLRWIVVLNRGRIIAVTDRRLAVFSTGQFRWQRTTPSRLLYSLPRATILRHDAGSWSKVPVGEERIWLPSKAYPLLDEANAGASGAAPSG